MESTPPPSKNTSGFVQLSLETLRSISRADGGYNDLAAYVVLCGGVNGRQSDRYCTHGALSVSKRTGISYRAAAKAIEWLHKQGFLRATKEQEPHVLGKSRTVTCVINDADCLDVAISKLFLEGGNGSSKNPPLQRIIDEIDGGDEIPRPRAVMDAIILFAALMKEQDFGDCAGVDPDAWHFGFVPVEPGEDGDDTDHVVPVPGSNGVLVTVKEADTNYTTISFMSKVFGENPSDEDAKSLLRARFWHAIHQLEALRLVYRVHVLWSGDPLDKAQRRKAYPLATSYIKDSWARQIDPHLQYEANRAAWRTEARDRYSDFTAEPGSIPFVGSGRYRYIVRSNDQKTTFLVGQLRARHWASTPSTVKGREIEARRTGIFLDSLQKLGRV